MNASVTASRLITAGAVALPALLLTKQAWSAYSSMSQIARKDITELDTIPDSFRNSSTIKTIVNPRSHVSIEDSRFMRVDLPDDVASKLSNEVLLSAFFRGFFAGHVFALERIALRLAGMKLVNYPALDKDIPQPPIWDASRLQGDVLPPPHTVLFGCFQVSHIENSSSLEESSSTIDVVYGSGKGQFGGAHRFTISRDITKAGTIEIQYSSCSCNPTVNKALKPDFMFSFHKLYAMWLFRESVAEVTKRIQAEKP